MDVSNVHGKVVRCLVIVVAVKLHICRDKLHGNLRSLILELHVLSGFNCAGKIIWVAKDVRDTA